MAEFRVYIAVGANVEPERNIVTGLTGLARLVTVDAVSSFYRTTAIGRPEQEDFLNGVIAIRTILAPRVLKEEVLRELEYASGRVRGADPYAPRPLDLDILLYGTLTVDEPGLAIPDPEIAVRPFLAAGLIELEPDLVLPGDSRPLRERVDPDVIAALKKEDEFTRELKENLHHES